MAVLFPQDKTHLVSRVLGIVATGNRPMRVFHNRREVHRWIESQKSS